MFNNRINKIKECGNKISDLNTKKIKYLKKKQVIEEKIKIIDEEISNIDEEKFSHEFQLYLNKERREELLQNAEKYGYSHKKICELKEISDEWNQDRIGRNELDSFRDVEVYVKNNREPYKGNFFYKFSKIFSNQKEKFK